MEKFLLGALLADDKLNIVDEENIVVPVFLPDSVVEILFLFRMASISSLVNFSLVTYKILAFGLF